MGEERGDCRLDLGWKLPQTQHTGKHDICGLITQERLGWVQYVAPALQLGKDTLKLKPKPTWNHSECRVGNSHNLSAMPAGAAGQGTRLYAIGLTCKPGSGQGSQPVNSPRQTTSGSTAQASISIQPSDIKLLAYDGPNGQLLVAVFNANN